MKYLSRTLLFTLPTSLLLMSTSSYAAIDAQGASELKSLIGNYIQEQQKITAATGATLEVDGETVVTPQSTYYSIIMPRLVTHYPGDSITYDMGKTAINAMPGNTPDEWKISFSLPKTVSVNTPKDGKINIHFGSQKTSGIWNSKLNYMFRLNAEYKDVSIDKTFPAAATDATAPAPEPENVLKIATFNIVQNLQEDSPGSQTWSGPADFNAKNITADKMSLGEVSAHYTMKNIDYTVMSEIRNDLKSITEKGEDLNDLRNNPAAALGIFDVIVKMLEKPMGAFTSEFTMKDLKVMGLSNAQSYKEDFSLSSAHFGFDSDLINPQKASMALRLGMNGMSIPLEDNGGFAPKSSELEIKVNSLPLAELLRNARQMAALANPDATQTPPQDTQPPKSFQQILIDAQTNLSNKLDINSDILNVHGQGTAQASAQSMIGVIADQTWEIKGLDAFLEKLKADQQNPGASNEIAQKLAVLQIMGQISPDHPDTRTYHLIVDDKGQMTMNGTDMMSMMGNMR